MKWVRPSQIAGMVSAPSSKSLMIRATAAALLARGESRIRRPSRCGDGRAGLGIAEALGAYIEEKGNLVKITGGSGMESRILDCRESGLCLRMFTPIAALGSGRTILSGTGTLRTRPVGMVETPLRLLGAEGQTSHGYPPVVVKGPLKGGNAVLDGSLSSQFLTGLLLALPVCAGDSELLVTGLNSKPYVAMTLDVLSRFGISITAAENFEKYSIKGNQRYTAASYEVEGDWSGAAFLLVAGALCGKAKVGNLNADSHQADKKILEALEKANARIIVKDRTVSVEKNDLKAFTFDATESPDLFPPLTALASGCDGKSVIYGVERLKHKESDRAQALLSEFSKIGAKVCIQGNRMEIEGILLKGGFIDSHDDHRIVMAGAVAGLISREGVRIDGWQCVSKSYPDFFKDLRSIGGNTE